MSTSGSYGLAAEFLEPHHLLIAVQKAYDFGYRKMDAYTPFPVDGLAEAMGFHHTGVPLVTLLCGIAGGLAGYGLQLYSAVWDYPLNVGGRPLHSWPAFVPITFELTVLFAALGAAVGMILMNGLPRLSHPIFEMPLFEERNASRFYLCIEREDSYFRATETKEFLNALGAINVWEVPS
jgi:hypothetical protein